MTLETIMNIEALKTFLVVAEVKNFTKAAQQLFVVQSTITNRIKELEKEIGQPLFDRDNKHITLTHAGEHFYEYSQRFLELEEKMKMEFNSCNTYSKIINIGCVNCIYNCHLKPHISQLMNKHTNICLNVILDHSRHLLNRLHDNSIDVCFSYLATNEISYKCIPYKTDEIIFVTNSQNIQFSNGIHNGEILHLPIIYSKFMPKSGFDWIHDIFPPHYVFQFTISVIKEIIPFLLQYPYYAFLPRKLIEKELKDGLLIEIPLLDYHIPPLQSYIIMKSNAKYNPLDYF